MQSLMAEKNFPFFKHFFLGGVNSVRGYDNGSIGPRDFDTTTGQLFAVGGTKRVVGNAELFLPVPFIKQSNQFRLSAFVDGGGVYGDNDSINSEYLRYTAGVGGDLGVAFWSFKSGFSKATERKNWGRYSGRYNSKWDSNSKA